MQRQTDEDIIINYLTSDGEVKLTKPQQKKLERWDFADDCIRHYNTRYKVVKMIVGKFGVSKATATKDYYSTMNVFGSTFRHNRDYHLDILLQQIAETRKMAKATGNAMAMARCDANYQNAMEKFMGDKDAVDYSDINLDFVQLAFAPETLGIELLPEKELAKQLELLSKVSKKDLSIPETLTEDAVILEEITPIMLDDDES